MTVAEGKATGITVSPAAAAACTSCLAVVVAYRMPPPPLPAAAALLPSLARALFYSFPSALAPALLLRGERAFLRQKDGSGRTRTEEEEEGATTEALSVAFVCRVVFRECATDDRATERFLPPFSSFGLSFAARALRFCRSGLSEPQYVGGGGGGGRAVGGEDRFKWHAAARWRSRVEGRRESE